MVKPIHHPYHRDALCTFDDSEFAVSRILRPEDISEDDLKVPVRVPHRVLLVRKKRDENAIVLNHLETTACKEFDFSSASSTTDALAKLKEEPFDLVVLALEAPPGQELDSFDALKRAFPELPIVILSNTKDHDLALAAIKRGAHDFLTSNSSYPIELVRLRLLYSIERSRTERAARAVAKTEKFALRSVVENSPLMFVRLDRTYVVRDCNRNFAEVIGQPRSQIRRRRLFDVIFDWTEAEVDHLSTGEQLLRKRVAIIDPANGTSKEVYWNCFGWPFYKSNSEEREIIIVAIDVTREVLLDQFREEFLAAVAHDIKNPVVGHERILSSLLKSHPDLPAEVASSLTTLRNSGLQLLNLLSTLVEIYRLDSGDMGNTSEGASINEAIELQIEELQCIASASQRNVVLQLTDKLPLASIDGTAAYRLVANLVHNALQNAVKDTDVTIKTSFDDNDVTLEVHNEGPEIKPESLAKLFQRFSRSPNGTLRANSSGLGLYLCKQTIESCGGTIMCISDGTSGTSFVVKLPRHDG